MNFDNIRKEINRLNELFNRVNKEIATHDELDELRYMDFNIAKSIVSDLNVESCREIAEHILAYCNHCDRAKK